MREFDRFACFFVLAVCGAAFAEPRPAVLSRPQFDPSAPRIELFAGLDQGLLAARMIPHDETRGAVFLENLSSQPVTVELPEAFVGVQVLPQIGLQIPLPPGSGNGLGSQPGGTASSGNQPVGGRATTNGPTGGPQPTPFFSIPAERMVRWEYQSVCLRHGAATPNSGNVYRLIPVQQFSSDARLPRLLGKVGRSTHDQSALQAAAWHLSDDMSWDHLAGLKYQRVNAPDRPQFSQQDLKSAQQLIAEIAAEAPLPSTVSTSARRAPTF